MEEEKDEREEERAEDVGDVGGEGGGILITCFGTTKKSRRAETGDLVPAVPAFVF